MPEIALRAPNQRAQCGKARGDSPRRHESGAALAEFAVVAILVWVLLAGILDFGRAMAAQQILQNAAGSAARERSLRELPAQAGFVPVGRDAIFDDGFLVVGPDLLARCGLDPEALSFDSVAEVMRIGGAGSLNRLLLPLWIRDEIGEIPVLRYPGAVLQRATPVAGCETGSQYTVRIPEVGPTGSLVWSNVVEPLRMDDRPDPFRFPSPTEPGEGAWAAIRVQYPFQAAGFQAWRDGAMVETTEPQADAPPDGLTPIVSSQEGGAYAGRLGLGVLYSMGREVRPFRRVLSARAAFRREVFAP